MLLSSARSAARAGPGRRLASTIALKYSKAVYSAALKSSPQTLAKVQSELSAISSALKSTPALEAYVSNPTLSHADKAKGLDALFAAGAGGKKEGVSDLTKNFFSVLIANNRLVETQGIIEGFNELVAQYNGELNVTVTSATPLQRAELSKLEASLKQSQAAKQAKTVKVTNKVNPAILGGLVVDFGDKTIDLSVSSRVNKLNGLLQEAV